MPTEPAASVPDRATNNDWATEPTSPVDSMPETTSENGPFPAKPDADTPVRATVTSVETSNAVGSNAPG